MHGNKKIFLIREGKYNISIKPCYQAGQIRDKRFEANAMYIINIEPAF